MGERFVGGGWVSFVSSVLMDSFGRSIQLFLLVLCQTFPLNSQEPFTLNRRFEKPWSRVYSLSLPIHILSIQSRMRFTTHCSYVVTCCPMSLCGLCCSGFPTYQLVKIGRELYNMYKTKKVDLAKLGNIANIAISR